MARCGSCHLFIVDMNRPVAAGSLTSIQLSSLKFHHFSRAAKISGFKDRTSERRRLGFVVSAELSKAVSIGLDSKVMRLLLPVCVVVERVFDEMAVRVT